MSLPEFEEYWRNFKLLKDNQLDEASFAIKPRDSDSK